MAKRGKKYLNALKVLDKEKLYSLEEAVNKVKEMADITKRNFDQTVELIFRLGVDPKYADQMVRGSTVLPNGLTSEGVSILQSALNFGVNIAGVNIMAMDYLLLTIVIDESYPAYIPHPNNLQDKIYLYLHKDHLKL
jgi:hypothetical protein